ncbi:unnamed protein product [Prunus brigantina]
MEPWVPPYRYSPKGKVRYAIAHYVSHHKLSPECKEVRHGLASRYWDA